MATKGNPPAAVDLLDLDSHDEHTAPRHHRQMRYALRFSAAYGGTLMHVRGLGWYRWAGSHWATCEDGAEKRAVRKLLARSLQDIVKLVDQEERKRRFLEATALETDHGVGGVLALAKAERRIGATVPELDQGPTTINTPSGLLDLETGELSPSDPAARMTKVTGAKFDPTAESADWDAFLERIQPDEEIRQFLARSLGAAMLGEVRDQLLYIWHGAGANGKGTLRDAVAHALGSYAVEVSTSLLLQNKYGEQATMNGRLDLRGTRVAFCSEVPKGARMDEAVMKKLTGGDPVRAKKLYQDEITFDPTHQLIMLTNFLPEVSGDDPAVWRRMVAVPFPVNVPREEWDVQLSKKLKAAAPAVLAWLYEGWCSYLERGLAIPDAVARYTAAYAQDMDVLGKFLDERTVRGPNMRVLSAELFREWETYCAGEGLNAGTKTAFGKAMRTRGLYSEKASGRMLYRGLALAARDEDEDGTSWPRRSAG